MKINPPSAPPTMTTGMLIKNIRVVSINKTAEFNGLVFIRLIIF